MGLTPPPHLDTWGVEVRVISGESLLEARDEGRRRKEGVCQEDTGVKGIHFRNGLFPDTSKPPANVFCAHLLDKPGESFQLQMGFLFPFLRANDLRSSLLNIRARSFYSLVRRGYIRKVSVKLVQKYFSRVCSTDSISCSEQKN